MGNSGERVGNALLRSSLGPVNSPSGKRLCFVSVRFLYSVARRPVDTWVELIRRFLTWVTDSVRWAQGARAQVYAADHAARMVQCARHEQRVEGDAA